MIGVEIMRSGLTSSVRLVGGLEEPLTPDEAMALSEVLISAARTAMHERLDALMGPRKDGVP